MPFDEMLFDQERWNSYFSDVATLLSEAELILHLWGLLEERCQGSMDVLVEHEGLSKILMGGMTRAGELNEQALAYLYHSVFGTDFDRKSEFIASQARELPSRAEAKVKKTNFIAKVEELIKIGRHILTLSQGGTIHVKGTPQEQDPTSYLEEPESVVDLLRHFFELGANLTAGHNECVQFIMSLKCITRRYLRATFPNMKEEQLQFLQRQFGFQPLDLITIPTDERIEKMRDDYSFWGFPEEILGAMIVKLNRLFWVIFNVSREVGLEPSPFISKGLKGEFLARANRTLSAKGWDHNTYTSTDRNRRYFWDQKSLLVQIWEGASTNFDKLEDISLFEMIDDISPALFTGGYKITIQTYRDMWEYEKKEVKTDTVMISLQSE